MPATAKERKARNRLFSSSESESSDSADDSRDNSSSHADNAARLAASHPAPTPTRAFSMTTGRSASAKQSSSSSSATFSRNNGSSSASSGAATTTTTSAVPERSADTRRKTLASASSFKSSVATGSMSRDNSNSNSNSNSSGLFPERRGLFEQDDESETIESLQAQVKRRQLKKQTELDSVRSELEAAAQRNAELEAVVSQRANDAREYEIRLHECYRIIEKRNKQLMKASERVARYSEQATTQLLDLQTRNADLTAMCDAARAAADAARADADAQLRDQRIAFEAQLTQTADDAARAQTAACDALMSRVHALEAQTAADDVERQTLLKRCEDAEAIGRGLKFQLAKEQQEKKFLRNQLAALQSSSSDAAGTGANAAAGRVFDEPPVSPASSVASAADLASFDYTRVSMAESPGQDAAPTRRHTDFAPPSIDTSAGEAASAESAPPPPPPLLPTVREGKAAAVRDDLPPPPPPPTPSSVPPTDEKASPTLLRPGSASTNFFEKLSIKFKRSTSSPRATAKNDAQTVSTAGGTASAAAAATSGASFSSTSASSSVLPSTDAPAPTPAPTPVHHGTSRRDRPRMYVVAQTPSTIDDDESSDSIFGSESDLEHSASESEDGSPPMPPPPPEATTLRSAAASSGSHVFTGSVAPAASTAQPSVASSLFGPRQVSGSGKSVDVDFSSSSSEDDDNDNDASARAGKSVRVDELPPVPAVHVRRPDRSVATKNSGVSASSENDSNSDTVHVGRARRTGDTNWRQQMPAAVAGSVVDAGDESDVSASSSSSDLSSSSSSSSSSDSEVDHRATREHQHHHRRRRERDSSHGYDRKRETSKAESTRPRSSSLPRTHREKSHSTGDDASSANHTTAGAGAGSGSTTSASHAAASKSRMNEYMEARAKKRLAKLEKKEAKEHAEHRKKAEYELEWEKMAQEERERKRKQQQARRATRRRPSSLKTVRVSQMKQQLNKQKEQHEQQQQQHATTAGSGSRQDESSAAAADDDRPRRPHSRRKSDSRLSDSDDDLAAKPSTGATTAATATVTDSVATPLPPEPTEADTELYLRQQARLRERHELELKKKSDADEADLVRGQIHRRVEMWAFGKELLHMILTLDQISASEALQKCQLAVIQSPDAETVRKAYRNIIRVIHPDKLRGATVPEQLEAKELFTVLNQAFEKFKAQSN